MSEIAGVRDNLARRFTRQRVVFWHDPEGDYAAELQHLNLPGVTAIQVANDEYAIKHRLLHEEPTGKFLVYRGGAVPTGVGNWLLDLELAYGVFTADRVSLIRTELGLTAEGIDEALRAHEKFFRAAKRVQSLKALLEPGDSPDQLRAKMTAVLLGQQEHSLLELTRALLIEKAAGGNAKFESLVDYQLDEFYWGGIAKIYGYTWSSPTIDDFVLWMFQQAIRGFRSDQPGGLRNIQLDFNSLRFDLRSQSALATLARRTAKSIGYASTIESANFRDLVSNDLFEEVEQKIISDLAREVAARTATAREVAEVVRKRKSSIWAGGYRKLYAAIESGSELLSELSTLTLTITSFDDGLDRYQQQWFRIDQLYRQFVYAARTAPHSKPLEDLRSEVEKFYANKFLFELGNAWQPHVDAAGKWRSSLLRPQTAFYPEHVAPITKGGRNKAVVIVSDALRYEVADELRTRIRQEDRFDAELDAVLGVLPSYTQLGMAALLPHSKIGHSHDGDPVLVDGQRTDGSANRTKVLKAVDGKAIQAEDVLSLSRDELRDLYSQNQVLYVYHNRIDATGDKAGTERQVFEAAEETLRELVDLVKRLTNANATNILITADHGFLFQDSALADAFYLSTLPQGDEIVTTNRRYVLGRGMKQDSAFRTFEPEQLGLDSDLQVQLPKSIHRLRLPGAGSRFVHGGASLQEIVVPVLTINKKRRSDTRLVHVEVLPESDKITTGQLVVKLFQSEPVSEKVQPRAVRAGLYVGETLISNQPELTFDQESSDKRDRYQNANMLLSQDANDYNNRSVEFRLEERIPNTNQWRTYQKALYTLRRSFASDFDF
ncbi:BREX-1 system phosphatase PglZ type A [Microbacterium sp. zg.Y625]|uniref:BREX-1 system phosphatase PglZ type A n=1 Tax=Microbacterium jiangjiandongii TaxID=3049071 RepID=UPI00214BB47B|nr:MULTISPECIES: BREX-1 system phosphatase PglZ type A [unclassified Microbacterium]MCR2791696.1 BREX-1 system phosphatase PglZ type A [Microbacterium sp. zg.Y625]WIM24514.1 BREX-1 system phosphatase PglZ type A [Microbacterium sp. zg-Y625]